MDEQLWSVWIRNSAGWRFVGHVTKCDADKVVAECMEDGIRCRIHPRHRNSISDIREG